MIVSLCYYKVSRKDFCILKILKNKLKKMYRSGIFKSIFKAYIIKSEISLVTDYASLIFRMFRKKL